MRAPLSVPIRTVAPMLSVLLHAAVFALLQFSVASAPRLAAPPDPIPLEIVKESEAPKKEPEPLKSPEPIPPAPKTETTPLPESAPAPTPPAAMPSPERRMAALPPPPPAPAAPALPPLPAPRAPNWSTPADPVPAPAPSPEIAKREAPPHAGTEVDEDSAHNLDDKAKTVERWELDPLRLSTGHRCGAARLTAMLHLTQERGGVYQGLLSRRIAWERCKPETAVYSIELRLVGAAAVLAGQGFRDVGRYENGIMYLTDAYGSSIWRRK